MKEFVTAAKAATEEDTEYIEFMIDGTTVRAHRATSGQMAMVYADMNDRNEESTRVAGIIDFFFGLLDEDSQHHLERRLMDREDPFEFTQITDILAWLMEEWTGRPTSRSSDSAQSPRAIGPKSTGSSRNGASTRGRSQSIASAT